MRKRGVPSPDRADALAYAFAGVEGTPVDVESHAGESITGDLLNKAWWAEWTLLLEGTRSLRDRWHMSTEGPVSAMERLELWKIAADFVSDRLEDRMKQRDRLESRTSLIVTSSGGLITVVGVLSALLGENYDYPVALLLALAFSIFLLLLAVVVAQASAMKSDQRRFLTISFDELERLDRDVPMFIQQRLRC
jgi:hypothetical protein